MTLEYSANLAGVDLARVLAALHDALAGLGIELDDCKTRAYRCDAYLVGSGAPGRAFAHLTLALLDRRSPELQHAAGERLLGIVENAFAAAGRDCDVTVEVRAMRSAGYFKVRHGPAQRETRPALPFYFDYVSPYSYLAWRQIGAIAARHGRIVEPVPIVFGAVLGAHGTTGPAEQPAKRRYVLKDIYRKARRAGVSITLPPSHPFNPLIALRASSLPALDRDARHRLIGALFAAVWHTGEGVEAAGAVARIATSVGLDGEEIERAASEPEAKARLRAQTDQAIAAGVFGVPTVIVDGELFWGVDSLEALDGYLDQRDPIPPDLLARWEVLPASASRKP